MFGFHIIYILLALFILLMIVTFFVIFLLITRVIINRRQKKQIAFENAWRENIFEYLYSEQEPNELIDRIPASKYVYLLGFLRDFLLNLKGNDLDKLARLFTDTSLKKYLIKRAGSISKKKKNEAIYFLKYVNDDSVKILLKKFLASKNELIFRTTVESLSYLNETDIIDRIFEFFAGKKQFNIDGALSMLVKFDRSICPILTNMLGTKKSNDILHVIIMILRHHRYAEAIDKLLPIMINSGHKDVIIESIKYLGEIKDPDSINTLRYFLAQSKPAVSVAAIEAASKIGHGFLEDIIISKLDDRNLEVKIAAARAMSTYSPNSRAKLLELSRQNSKNENVIIAKRITIENSILTND